MALVAGYRAVILAAEALPKLFPMFMTAAGTVVPAKVLVVGAGVAGLQAIAIARKLGAVVNAYDVRPVVKEQVESLGAAFVDLGLETSDAESKSGYAKELGDEFYQRQREVMTNVVAQSDVVITTAAIPGKPAPILVTEEMVAKMAPGSVIVDIAAERGGNCELTQAGETVNTHGVSILGPLNIASDLAHHASQLYSQNLVNFLLHLIKDDALSLDTEDEIVASTLVCSGGQVVHPMIESLLAEKA
jgi:NAD(P) transhydrogenase subunit alpha